MDRAVGRNAATSAVTIAVTNTAETDMMSAATTIEDETRVRGRVSGTDRRSFIE